MPEPRRPRRGPQRPRGSRIERDDRRPNWEPREKRSTWRHSDDPSAGNRRRDERGGQRDSSERRDNGDRRATQGDRREHGDRRARNGERRDFGGRRGPQGERRQGDRHQGDRRDRDNRGGERREQRDSDYGDRRVPDHERRNQGGRTEFSGRRDQQQSRDDGPRRDFEDRKDSVYYPSRHATPFSENEDLKRERLQATTVNADDVIGVTFGDLGLGAGIAGALKSMGAELPFPIQAAAIPPALEARDVLGRGRTGSGKTIAFAAPIVERLLRERPDRRAVGRPPRALILAPTRELALQIDRTTQSIGKAVGIFTTTVVGGVRQGPQVRALDRGVDILIGTPGRIEDLVEQRYLDLGRVEIAVVDEADHMCDLGFLEPVQRLLRRTRPDSQKLLFSATLDTDVDALVGEFLRDPAVVEVADADDIAPIDHRVLVVERGAKDAVLDQIVAGPGPILVFAATRVYAERLATRFEEQGRRVASLHGDLNQHRRTRSLELLRRRKIDVLVATDVAARGIHVDDVALVVQADPPDEYKTYLHRSGRTGRAGSTGVVVTLVSPARVEKMQALLERAEIRAPMIPVTPGDDLLDSLGAQ